jgi:uncharacterized membrane protein
MRLSLDLSLLFLGAFGVALSVYMTALFLRVQRGEEVQCFDDVCPMVLKTPYAQSFGFPNTYLAIFFYVALLVFAVLRLMGVAAWLFIPIAIASGLSVVMSLYLMYALLVQLKQT